MRRAKFVPFLNHSNPEKQRTDNINGTIEACESVDFQHITIFSLALRRKGIPDLYGARSQDGTGASMSTVRVVLTRMDAGGKYLVEDFQNALARVTNDILYVYRSHGPSHEDEEALAALPLNSCLYWLSFD